MATERVQQPFNVFDLKGRASRAEFALVLALWTAMMLLRLTLLAGSAPAAVASLVLSLLLILSGIRRLHDRDQSGWWILLGLVPLVNFIFLPWLAASPADARVNRFGPPARLFAARS